MQNVIDVSRKLKRNLVLENVILCGGWSKMVKLYIYYWINVSENERYCHVVLNNCEYYNLVTVVCLILIIL